MGGSGARLGSGSINNGSNSIRLGDEVTWQGRYYTVVQERGEQLVLRPTNQVNESSFVNTRVEFNDILLDRYQLRR